MGLPRDILSARVRNEVNMCKAQLRHEISVSDSSFSRFPVEIDVTLLKSPGPVLRAGSVTHAYTHKLKIIVTEHYPYEKPIVRWQSPIFHPNIMIPRDGGYVCTKLLDDWAFHSTLVTFIKGIETLLMNPNPGNPYGSESCMLAAEYFRMHSYAPPVIVESAAKPRIVQGGQDA
ncbi:MAG: ubiquitin-conjugating enzyme E2 [Candidatus Thermoplasmatota archaeon]